MLQYFYLSSLFLYYTELLCNITRHVMKKNLSPRPYILCQTATGSTGIFRPAVAGWPHNMLALDTG